MSVALESRAAWLAFHPTLFKCPGTLAPIELNPRFLPRLRAAEISLSLGGWSLALQHFAVKALHAFDLGGVGDRTSETIDRYLGAVLKLSPDLL
jgi:hypothetical protein